MEKIDIRELDGVRFGNAQSYEGMTGVTALVFDAPNLCGIDISGGGPAARESFLFTPLACKKSVDALLLSGGSAYGLEAASGAMRYLEERGRGYPVGGLVVPIVPQSCIFDLGFGGGKIRPDIRMGYEACRDAEKNRPVSGSVGGGTGATVGKIFGMARAQKSGIGYAAYKAGGLKMGAVVIVNALGDVFDFRSGKKVAGALDETRTRFASCEDAVYAMQERLSAHGGAERGADGGERRAESLHGGANTTIGAVITNGDFSQQALCKIAAMTRSALARSVNPVGTDADGDTVYAVSTGGAAADVNAAGLLACRCLSEAILDAVTASKMSDAEYLKYIQ